MNRPSTVLDGSAADRLAAVDPALGLLPKALPATEQRAGWRVHDVAWDPGVRCRLAFRVERPPTGATFVAVDVTTTEVRRADYRQDPRLLGAAPASDPEWVADRLGGVAGEPVLDVRAEPVRYRPGSRCVWRYLVRTPSGNSELYAKAVRPDVFPGLARRLAQLSGSAAGSRLVPSVVALWPEVGVVVSSGIPGRTASSLLGDGAVPATERVRLAHGLGELLARVHEIRDVEAPPWSTIAQISALREAATAVRLCDRRVSERLAGLVDVLADSMPGEGTQVLGHGGFRAGQVVRSARGRLVALDVDGLCVCDRGRDLGTVLAHLRWQGLRLREQRAVLRAAERAALNGYLARGGGVDPASLRWWRAAGLLQVAVRRYRRLEISDWPAVPGLVDAAEELLRGRQARARQQGPPDLLDPEQMTVLLRPRLRKTDTSARELVVESAEPLPGASGKRALVFYRIRGLTGDEPVAVVGKRLADPTHARLLHEHLKALHEGPFGHGPLRVPEPLAILPQHRLVLYRHCVGTPLGRTTDPARAAEGVRRAAHWLAGLHDSPVRFPRTLSLAGEVSSTQEWATAVGRVQPELADSATGLALAWADAARSLPDVEEVPIHKDFRPDHVLLGESTWAIDLDEARQGDPGLDIAHFCAYLVLAFGEPSGSRLAERFVGEYRAATGRWDRGGRPPYLAYSWLKIAKQWAAGSAPCRAASPAQRAAEVAAALGRGWACLSESSTSCAAGRGSHRRSS